MDFDSDFLQSVREGNWEDIRNKIGEGGVRSSISSPGESVLGWLIELNAPSDIVISLLDSFVRKEGLDKNKLGLLEICLDVGSMKDNTLPTFLALLDYGLDPNVISNGGSTLFQKAISLNKELEVMALVRHGVDPNQKSVFGRESTSNFEEAVIINNSSSRFAIEAWNNLS